MEHDYFRPLGTAEIVAQAFGIYRAHLAALVTIALAPQLLLLLVSTLLEKFLPPDQGFFGLLLATTVFNAVALAAITTAVTGIALGAAPAMAGTYALSLRNNTLGVIVAYGLTALMTSAGFLFFIVPGFLLGGVFVLVVPAMVVEGKGPFQAITRSMVLVRQDLSRGVAVFAFVIGVGGVLPLAFLISVGVGPFTPILSALVGAVTLPLAYTANVLLYFSSRAGEGFSADDLKQEMIRGLTR